MEWRDIAHMGVWSIVRTVVKMPHQADHERMVGLHAEVSGDHVIPEVSPCSHTIGWCLRNL